VTLGEPSGALTIPEQPPPRFYLGSKRVYWHQPSQMPITAEGGSLRLPKLILWAFRLNEGDLLAVSPEESEGLRCRFRSYGAMVRGIVEAIGEPWVFIEPLLRLPKAAVGPLGALDLPEEARSLAPAERTPLFLRVDGREGFTLQPANGRRISPRLLAQAAYVLPVESGSEVKLPEDVLWVLGLGEGDRLACRTYPGQADFEPLPQGQPSAGWSVVELGEGGALRLPESMLRDLEPQWRIRLSVEIGLPEPTKSGAALRLTYEVE
jgi:hypothetical protein